MATLVHAMLLLFAAPAILHLLGQGLLVIVLYFAINIAFGALFWRGRATSLYGRSSVALTYVASGVLLFNFLITEGVHELAFDGRPASAGRLEAQLPKPAPRPVATSGIDDTRLAGAPNDYPHNVHPAANGRDGEWWSPYVELAGALLRGERRPR